MKTKPKKPKLYGYRISLDGETHHYAAVSETAALRHVIKDWGFEPSTVTAFRKEYPDLTIEKLADMEALTVRLEDAPEGEQLVNQSIRDWCREGKGCFATTAF